MWGEILSLKLKPYKVAHEYLQMYELVQRKFDDQCVFLHYTPH